MEFTLCYRSSDIYIPGVNIHSSFLWPYRHLGYDVVKIPQYVLFSLHSPALV